jgi:hypothetical protein
MMIEELHASYRFYYQNHNREPNALVLGFNQKGELIRECMQMHPTVPLDMPPRDGSPMRFMGCEVIETGGNTMRFALVGDEGFMPNDKA